MPSIFNFKDQYCAYAEYHNNNTNKIIHTIFVPTLIWTGLVLTTVYLGAPISASPLDAYGIVVNISLINTIIYSTYYVLLHPVIGTFAAGMIWAAYFTSNAFVAHGLEWTGIEPGVLALGMHVAAWIFQFVGHGVYEKRAPALLDNLLQALVLAFMFVWTHALFDLGFYPQMAKEFQAETDRRVAVTMSFPNTYHEFHTTSHPHHDIVYTQKNSENFTHEILAGAAGFEAMRLLEDHMAKVNGIPQGSNHQLFRELLAAFAAAEIDRIIEQHNLQSSGYNVEKMKQDAKANALKHYEGSYGKQPTGLAAFLDFRCQYGQYAEYHNNRINQIIHTIFVPILMWSAFAITSCLSPVFSPWPLDAFGVPLNLTVFSATAYSVYYTVLDPIIGGAAGLVVFGMLVSADWFVADCQSVTGIDPLVLAAGIHVASWIIQFVGHGVFEKRSPAILDNPIQPIVLAPLFVWTHGLFDLGLFAGLKAELQNDANRRIAVYKASLVKSKKEE
ncbi:hypothetical protein HDU98_007593 [Podochytrium sp. JEL0797]|nr:hypothetical protein HDU98_007593 [Podochytrium sp. JEL0797]